MHLLLVGDVPYKVLEGSPVSPSLERTPGKMVKSHVELSPDLTWALVQKNNVYVRRSRSATRQKCHTSFSAEKNNLLALHCFKHSGERGVFCCGKNAHPG